MVFKDRVDAGHRLAVALKEYQAPDPVVFGIARGGVVPAAEVAHELGAPLDALVVRKIGHPLDLEMAIGAVAEEGEILLDLNAACDYDIYWLERRIAIEREEARRRHELYNAGRSAPDARGKTAIVVDDGMATGLTMKLAVNKVRRQAPAKVIVAVPAAPWKVVLELGLVADNVVSLLGKSRFLGSVGAHYEEFDPVYDREVIQLLEQARRDELRPDQRRRAAVSV